MTSSSGPKQLIVNTPQGLAGTLTREAQYVFNYQSSATECQVAIGVPIQAQSYTQSRLHPVFGQNLPEGFLLRRLSERLARNGQKPTAMRLLSTLGGRQIGRLSFREPEAEIETTGSVNMKELLHGKRSAGLFEYLVDQFMGSGISGVQPKVMASTTASPERAALVGPDIIIKAAGKDYEFLAGNEYLCMSAAKRAGLSVPEFWLSDDDALFVIRRFDLAAHGNLGFEDMATIAGEPSDSGGAYKYRSSYEQVARHVLRHCADIESCQRLFEYVTLSVSFPFFSGHAVKFFAASHNSWG